MERIRKYPRLHMVRVWDHEVDISIKEIANAFLEEAFEMLDETLEYE